MKEAESSVYKSRWIILAIIVMQPFMATLDSSIVNVALPVMAKSFSANMASIEWVVTSYLIVISATILVFGRLGDIKGKTTMFNLGLILFTIGSFLCGISRSLPMLIISRVIQAIGAAGTMATNQGIVTQVFPTNERGRALGILGTFVALGTLAGPPLGGFIVSIASWQYIFLINVPVGIITFILGIKLLPRGKGNINERLDIKGAVLFALSIISLFMSIIKGQELGYGSSVIIFGFILAIASMTAFIWLERNIKSPLLQLDIFKNKLFSISIFCGFISFIAIGSINIIQPFYLQDVVKLSPSTTGLFMTVYPLILSIVAPVSGYLSDRIGSELLTFIGLLFTITGLSLMSALNQNSAIATMIIYVSILSIGNGLFQSPNNSLVMSTVPKNKLGIAGSVNALVRNLGIVFGVSFSTTLLYNRMSHRLGYKVAGFIQGREDVFVYGMRIVYLSAAAICAIGAILTALRLYQKKIKGDRLRKENKAV
ncbi:DHA2 family efflux MFS transporter permease subunit [Clostridium bovifaecis]|uniref:DHA2 family efflux MFS transporter permease subunit n=1 Tax=Clostridium bovifaecis TaxID=2184719 RepID=A0A6I6EL09_9CLOT|nr:DHA2 family efflux MFS transporter permease subunit [Clostridium bovifaecis]